VKCETCSPTRVRNKGGKPATGGTRTAVQREGLLEAVRAELAAAGVVGGHAGQAALLLAERIEFGQDSGSAVAVMVRQLHESMARALVTQEPAAADPVEVFRGRLRSV
jgi:hypothetical protein